MSIKWEVFTNEERALIDAGLKNGHVDSLTQIVMIDTPEKEYWMNEIVNQNKVVQPPLESKVALEMLKEQKDKKVTNLIDSPEEEAKWQAKIDAERAEHEEKARGKKKKVKVEEKA